MPQISAKNLNETQKAILSTLSFFHIYKLPLTAERTWQLLYKRTATLSEVQKELDWLAGRGIICENGGLYSLAHFDTWKYHVDQLEIKERWKRVKKYYWLLSAIPFVECMCVINSVAMGNADSESDIDFFVITKPNRLYFVRTIVIVLFRLLGVYKTRKKIKGQFCFGFYITTEKLELKSMLLKESDPYMVFWLGTIVPIIGFGTYEKFIRENKWLYEYLPNFRTELRKSIIRNLKPSTKFKHLFEILNILAIVVEPFLRRIHVRHTFKLPENHWATSSTVANRRMLKLHALDPRLDLRQKFEVIRGELYR